MSYELRKVVGEFLDETDLTDFREMATELAKRVPAKHLRDALAAALPTLIQTVNQQRRMSNPILTGQMPGVRPRPSAKVAGIAAMHASWLRTLVHVGDGENRPLGDCGYEDLMFAAEERREHARRNAAKADQYEALADRLRANGVDRVADLPAADLAVLEVAA